MSELTTNPTGPKASLATRREGGIKDAMNRLPATSADAHYMEGYRLGERLRPTLTSSRSGQGQEAVPGTRRLSIEEEIAADDESLLLARYIVHHEASIPTDTWAGGSATAALKRRLAQIRKLVLSGDLEGLRAITGPTEREIEFVHLIPAGERSAG